MAFGDIAKLLASLDLDTRGFDKGAGRVSGDLSKMEGGLGRVSTRAIAFGSAIGVGIERLAEKGINVLFDSIRQGEDGLHTLQDAQAQTQAVIESTGGAAGVTAQKVRDLAESIEGLTTADDKSVQNAENLLLTFTNIGSGVFPDATKAVVDLGIALNGGNAEGVDFSKTAIQVGKALNDPVKGLTALRKVGVSFTADQEKQIKALVKSGDTMGAQKIILGELEKEFGKAGEAAGKSGAAGVRRLNDAVEDAQIALADGLAPALDEIRGDIARSLSDPGTQQDLRNLGVWLGDAAKSGLAFAKSIPWQQVGEGLKTAAGFAGKLIDVFAHLPPGVQATIIGLTALNKLSGGGVIKIGVDLFKEGAQSIFKGLFQRGSSPANPLFVTGTGLGGGGVPTPAGGGGGIGAVGKLFLIGEAIGLIAAVNEVRDHITSGLNQQSSDIKSAVDQQVKGTDVAALQQSLDGVNQGIEKLSHDPIGNALLGDQLSALQAMRDALVTRLDELNKNTSGSPDDRDEADRARKNQEKLDTLRDAVESAKVAGVTATQNVADTLKGGVVWTPSATVQVEDRRSVDALDEINRNTSGSPDDRDEKDRAAASQRKLDTLRDKIEAAKNATISKQQATTTAVAQTRDRIEAARNAMVAAEHQTAARQVASTDTAADRIVRALYATRTNVNIRWSASDPLQVSYSGNFVRKHEATKFGGGA